MGRELYESFPVIREWMDRTATAADFDLLHLLFHDQEENLQKTRWQQPAMFAMEHSMARHLTTLGIHPVAMAGHSLGELTALCLAGVYSPDDGFRIVNKRALCMDKAAGMHVEPGVMAAVDVPLDLLKEMIHGRQDIHIGNINSPNQIVLSGNADAIRNLGKKLKEMGYRCTLLKVSMAFHSPIMKVIHDELEAYVASIPFHSPKIPVISNTTMAPYPSDPDEIRRILMAHLESTVHWMNNVQTLWNDYGTRLFVEVGPGDILSNLITDTLPDSTCIQTCIPSAECVIYKTALAQLFVQGHLKVEGEPRFVSLPAFRKSHASGLNIPNEQSSPALAETYAHQEHIEALIQIIMDATGFNRDEIQPDMDLRRDLSIRSSRLPIIMDAAERQFAITIELEDFIGLRTVRDIAQKISGIVAKKEDAGLPLATIAAEPGFVQDEFLKPLEDEATLKRLVFRRVPVELSAPDPIPLSQGESVLFLSPDRDDWIAKNAGDTLRRDYGVEIIPMLFMQAKGTGQEGHDILTDEGCCKASQRISDLSSLAGMVITLPKGWSGTLNGIADVSRLLRGLFLPLKAFLQSPAKKFVVLIHCRDDAETLSRLLAEGMLGLFLSAAQEYSSVQFRTLEIDRNADLRAALRGALDRGYSKVEMIHCDGKVFTSEGYVAPSIFRNRSSLNLNPGDIIVMSGGASGISAHLARSLVPFRPRIVFLGRTPIDTAIKSAKTVSGALRSESKTSGHRASEIAQTLADLHSSGIEATYHTCDVTDPEAVRAVMGEVANHYGRIDGIIHGAGVLRDGLLSQMTPDDFSMVTDVKFLGAWNLFSAAKKAGLKFFVGLSSVAAIQGNPGQTNYAAANRMMSALLKTLRRKNSAILFKALMLPPIEGAGMAEDPEVREMLKRKGVGYIHVNELAGLFCRELFVATPDDDWVMFMRRLPAVKTARINDTINPLPGGELGGGTVNFSCENLPMIEGITDIDMRQGRLEAVRSFSLEKDLWIADHKPFDFLKHPLVSAAMVLETFMEAARVVCPHLQVRGVRWMRFMDMIQCPPGIVRPCRISCRRVDALPGEALCEVSLSAQELSPTRRLTDRFTPHCTGQVILDGGQGNAREEFSDFPIRPDELQTQPMDHNKVLQWYADCSGFEGRYRVIDFLDGAGTGVVRGRTTCRQMSDFAHLQNVQYQYSPYLFEALMQLVGFYRAAMAPTQRQAMIPVEVGGMRFLRKCREGEQITLEARMRMEDERGFVWDARGIDDQGRTIMQVYGMRMQRVSE
jgi:malonyl CoA-acyl carrier protein transacylase